MPMGSCEDSPTPSLLPLALGSRQNFLKLRDHATQSLGAQMPPSTRHICHAHLAVHSQPPLHLSQLHAPSCQCEVLSPVPPGSIACHTQTSAHRCHHTPCQVVHPGHSHMPHPAGRSTDVSTLEKRVEDRSEALITEIRNNIIEKKDTINEMRNM